MDIVYDIETFPNAFTMAAECADAPFTWEFEISEWRDDSRTLIDWLYWLRERGYRMVGFNNIGFDYPVLHMIAKMGRASAPTIYDKAQAIFRSQDDEDGNGRWTHQVYPNDRIVTQIDLFKIHHFDNKARMTSLKALQFNMRSESVEDLPFPVGTVLTRDQVGVLKRYGKHDVSETKKFYHKSLPMIRFREELTVKYNRDFLNHNDTKIGKDYFVMQLEAAGVACYNYSPDKGRTPKQTKRPVLALGNAILPWISFNNPEFQRVLDWFKAQRVTQTKSVFETKPSARVGNLDFIFGTGGIHASIENEAIESDEQNVIVDLDVSSYYPNLAIVNQFFPAHLGHNFPAIYKQLYEQRKQYPKGTAENAMLKLALNGVYGDSNNPYSVFYDPLFTMSITLNGQFLLCLLAEHLLKLQGLRIIQCNTDGITVRLPREMMGWLRTVSQWWEHRTGMTLEQVEYKTMIVRDVNNYIAVSVDGKTKRKGAYEYKREWHQDASALVVPKVAERALVEGAPIRSTIEGWDDRMDFMQRIRVNRGSYLAYSKGGDPTMHALPGTVRYYVAKGGVHLWKWMPPLKKKPNEWRQMAVESGYTVALANDLRDGFDEPPDVDYYTREVEKLVMKIR